MGMLATPIDRIDGYIAEMHRLRLKSLAEHATYEYFLDFYSIILMSVNKVSLQCLCSKGWSDAYHATTRAHQSPLLADPTLWLLLSPSK